MGCWSEEMLRNAAAQDDGSANDDLETARKLIKETDEATQRNHELTKIEIGETEGA